MLGFHSTSTGKVEQAFSTDDISTTYSDKHTIANPYCTDMTCGCHTNWLWHAAFIHGQEFGEPSPDQYQTALSILGSTHKS